MEMRLQRKYTNTYFIRENNNFANTLLTLLYLLRTAIRGSILKEGIHKKVKILLKDHLHLLIWPIGLFLLKNISSSSGSISGKKLNIQWSILSHPEVNTFKSGGLNSHIRGQYSHIRRSVLPHPGSILPHPVVYTSTFQQAI